MIVGPASARPGRTCFPVLSLRLIRLGPCATMMYLCESRSAELRVRVLVVSFSVTTVLARSGRLSLSHVEPYGALSTGRVRLYYAASAVLAMLTLPTRQRIQRINANVDYRHEYVAPVLLLNPHPQYEYL